MNKNKIAKFLIILVGIFGLSFGLTEKVNASKLYDSLFWGITANFESGSFEGVVVVDDDGKFDEAYHSVARQTNGDEFDVSKIRVLGSSIDSISSWSAYDVTRTQGLETSDNKFSGTWGYPSQKEYTDLSINYSNLDTAVSSVMAWTQSMESSDAKHWICKNGTGNVFGAAWNAWTSTGTKGVAQCEGREKNAIYTWPGITDAGNVTSEDEAMLNWVNATLINNYNDALAFLMNNAHSGKFDLNTNKGRLQFLDFAAQVAYAARNKGSYKVQTDDFNIVYKTEKISTEEANELDLTEFGTSKKGDDFVKYIIQAEDGSKADSIIVRYRVPKGYGDNQRLAGVLVGRGADSDDLSYMTNTLTFDHVLYQAMFNYYTQGQTSLSADQFYAGQADWLERQIVGILDNFIKGIENFLGLYPFEELMLNRGTRKIRYWQGIVPSSWLSASEYFYLFTFSTAMIILLITLVRLAFAKSASTIGNVAKKVSLMEGIKKVILSAVLVVLFQPIFWTLCQLNMTIVSAVSSLVTGEVLFNSSTVSGGGTIASAVLSFVFFFISLKMNFTYMLRGITILLLYLLGPICLMLNGMGEKWGLITSNWCKELIGNLFIQSIHALILTLFITISRYGTQASIEKIVLVYSFVPLTEFIRTNIFALGKGLDDVASNMASGVGAVTGAMGAAALGGTAKALVNGGVTGIGSLISSKIPKGGGDSSGSVGGKISPSLGAAKSGEMSTTKVGSGKVGAGRKAANFAKAAATQTAKAIPGVLSGGMSTMVGLASGATNAQGRMDSFALHRGVSEMGGALENIPDNIERDSKMYNREAEYEEGQNNYQYGSQPADNARFENPNGYEYNEAENVSYVNNDKLAATKMSNEAGDIRIERISPGPNNTAVASCSTSYNGERGVRMRNLQDNRTELARSGIADVRVDKSQNKVYYKQALPSNYRATSAGGNNVKVSGGDISNAMRNMSSITSESLAKAETQVNQDKSRAASAQQNLERIENQRANSKITHQ